MVSGKVLDAVTKEPLSFVSLAFKNSKIGTVTNIDGEYSLDTYYATDSLAVSYVGYKRMAKKIAKDKTQVLNFELQPTSVQLKEFTIVAKDFENPAHEIIRRIIANKKVNNREKLDAYEYESYNKIEFDINNFSKEFTEKKVFKKFDFIFDYVDSAGPKIFLPVFITESLSDYYYRKNPKNKKEIIKATKVSGIDNESVQQFLGQMYQDVNIYDNNVVVFNKSFVSPISNYCFAFYKFYLTDSAYIGNKWCYNIEFMPKRDEDLVFTGNFWVNDTSYAIKKIDATLPKNANINFISSMEVRHEYDEIAKEVWLLKKEVMVVDFNLNITKSDKGFYGRKTTMYKNIVVNQPKDDAFFAGPENVIVQAKINEFGEDFWMENRHELISTQQQKIYNMVDSLEKNARFNTYVDLINFLITGYKIKGNFELGPMFNFVSWNPIEGPRLRLGGRTSNDFSTKVLLEAYGAYGFKDQRFKFNVGGYGFISKKPRVILGAYYKEDIDQLGLTGALFSRDNIFTSLFSRNPQDKLAFLKEGKIYIEREWFSGFSNTIQFTRKELTPRGSLKFENFLPSTGEQNKVNSLTVSEINLKTRFAYREKFLSGEFERISLGTRYPIITLDLSAGIKGFLNSDFQYQKLKANLSDNLPLGPLGDFQFQFEVGKVFGSLPFPFETIHVGNETFFRNSTAFNTMRDFEFISDQYTSATAEYHMGGFIFNKVPLLRKLKWREVAGLKGVYGGLSKSNQALLTIPDISYSLNKKPYAETYVGVENIFKVLRIDAIWRLAYLDHKNISKFTILFDLSLNF